MEVTHLCIYKEFKTEFFQWEFGFSLIEHQDICVSLGFMSVMGRVEALRDQNHVQKV